MANASIDGLVSGLNTTQIIDSLMQLAAQPQTALKSRVSVIKTQVAAYQAINKQVAALQTAAAALGSPANWSAMTTSSSSSSVAASASAGAQAGSFTFDVDQLARGQSVVFSGTASGTDSQVTSGGTPVVVTKNDGTQVTIDTGDGSLADVVKGFNENADAGVKATTIQVSPGVYRLQLSSAGVGADSGFAVAGLDTLGTAQTLQTAQDAQITVGKGSPAAFTITSSSNTFTDALPGVSFTVSQVTTGVTLTTAPDSSGYADKVKAFVDAANNVLAQITTATAYDADTKQGGPLTGDFTARQLQQNILSLVSGTLPDGRSPSVIGISVTRSGTIEFDRGAFLDAYAADPVRTQAAFAAGGSFTPSASLTGTVSFVRAGDASRAGSYDVVITQAASRASATLDTTSGLAAGQTVTLDVGGGAQGTYTVVAGETAQSLVDHLNELASDKGLDVVVSTDGSGVLTVKRGAYGSASTLTLSASGGLTASATTAGRDVAGTIDGQAASGTGQLLYTAPGTPGVDALTLQVTLDDADVAALGGASAGTFAYRPGLAQSLTTLAWSATDSATGSLTSAIASENAMVDDLNARISNWDVLLEQKRDALKRQYADLETKLGQMQSQSQWLASQISGLITNYAGTSSKSNG